MLKKQSPKLCEYGEQLYGHYAKNKDEFAKTLISELVASKKVLNQCPSVGIVTGRDNMKTYTFTSPTPDLVDPVLRELKIKFIRDNQIEANSTYFIDLEPESSLVTEISNHDDYAQL